jgi:hypothetical protein
MVRTRGSQETYPEPFWLHYVAFQPQSHKANNSDSYRDI